MYIKYKNVNNYNGDCMKEFNIEIADVNLEIARKINKSRACKNKYLPIKIENNELLLLTSNENIKDIKELEFLYSSKIKLKLIDEEYLLAFIDAVFLGQKENILEELLKRAVNQNSSDIHFEPQKEDVLIRFRIDGILHPIYKLNYEEYIKLITKVKVMGNMDITEKRRPQDGKLYHKIHDKNYDLRLSTIPILYGEKLVIRILYSEVFNYNLDSLNLNLKQKNKLNKIISLNNGLVIINGPTGSGKSSTLYSILKEINNKEINITTLEDPIEVIIEGINQMSLNRKAGVTFSNGLRSILRQDPDVIMVGEIRDEETAKMAVTASLTGHKVYSTIHTKTPGEVFYRLEDMGVKPYLIKDSLVGIISQRLIRTLCNECKRKEKLYSLDTGSFYNYISKGCRSCNFTGYKGRKAVSTVVLIDSKDNKEEVFEEIQKIGNNEMIDNLKELLIQGEISIRDYNKFLIEEGLAYEENKIIC